MDAGSALILFTVFFSIIGFAFFVAAVGIVDTEETLKRREKWLNLLNSRIRSNSDTKNDSSSDEDKDG